MRTPQRGVKEKSLETINISCATLQLYNWNVPADGHLETSTSGLFDSHVPRTSGIYGGPFLPEKWKINIFQANTGKSSWLNAYWQIKFPAFCPNNNNNNNNWYLFNSLGEVIVDKQSHLKCQGSVCYPGTLKQPPTLELTDNCPTSRPTVTPTNQQRVCRWHPALFPDERGKAYPSLQGLAQAYVS